MVVAKGRNAIALKIRELAAEHDIPTLEAPPLARALYAHCELEHTVPATLYTAVAEVMAYVTSSITGWPTAAFRPKPLPICRFRRTSIPAPQNNDGH